ncbi:MAG: hypothetical protein QOD28_452 [Acidobacteriota bacterium]|nr:hypothetical protein [Acidobacteriota bacterium]
MLRRITALTTMLFLLLTSVIMPAGATVGVPKNSASLKEQVKEKVQRAIDDARAKGTYDASGRMTATSVELPGLGKFKFEYAYDEQNRLQYIADESGGRTRYAYGKNGELQTITLPDGTRMYELDEHGKGVFFKRGVGRNNGGLRFNKSALVQGNACKAAVAAAAIATAQAAASCSTGDVAGCILNTAAAVAAGYAAYVACTESIEEGPVV